MDTAQILLYIVVGVLAVLLVAVGIQVFFILQEVRNTLSKANKVLEDAGVISESISKPVGSLSTILSGVKLGSLIASLLSNTKGKREDKR